MVDPVQPNGTSGASGMNGANGPWGAAPAALSPRMSGVFFDGRSNRRRMVEVRIGPTLEIVENGLVVAGWPWEWVRRADGAGAALRLRTANGAETARLVIDDPATAARLAAMCPKLDALDAHRGGGAARIVGWSLAATVSILFIALVGMPYAAERITPLIPVSLENRLGDMVDGQVKSIFGDKVCTQAEGQAAFDKLVGSLERAGGLHVPLRAAVLDTNVKNAIALPGGQVYLFRGLLAEARNVDEVAGVLAHELGHVHYRHGMQRLLQTGGASFLLGLLFGDVTGGAAVIFATRQLFEASYSRAAETQSDDFAVDTMKKLSRPAAPMGELLVRLTTGRTSARVTDVFASHPLSAERLERMKKTHVEPGAPLLTDKEWQALKSICGARPAADDAGWTAPKAQPASEADRSASSSSSDKPSEPNRDKEPSIDSPDDGR